MAVRLAEQAIQTLGVTKNEEIAADIDIVFETILEQMGLYNETADGTPMPMKVEPWPGGRWFRDLGNNSGHLWGHVQSIKPPTLLEIHGPLFMSSPAISHLQYRLTVERGITQVRFSHTAVGLIPNDLMDGLAIGKGWGSLFSRIREKAEKKAKEKC